MSQERRSILKSQRVSYYHLQAARRIADMAVYMRLQQPHTLHPNDASTFNLTDEQHRLRTFNANWNQALYDIQDFANEGFFSLSTSNNNLQCFSCGIILTKLPSNKSSFIIHLLASPTCKHLTLSDETNKTDGTYCTTQQANTGESHDFQDTSLKKRLEHNIKQAGFTFINRVDTTFYKCFSCLGTKQSWQQTDDPWTIYAQQFPFCPHITRWKTKFFVKDILKQDTYVTQQYTMYFKFLKQQMRCLNIDTLRTELWQLVNPDNTFVLLQNISIYHDTFSAILQYFAKTQTNDTQQRIDDQINSLQQRIQ